MNYSDSPIQFELTNNQLNDYFEKIISVHLNPFLNILCAQCPKKKFKVDQQNYNLRQLIALFSLM